MSRDAQPLSLEGVTNQRVFEDDVFDVAFHGSFDKISSDVSPVGQDNDIHDLIGFVGWGPCVV